MNAMHATGPDAALVVNDRRRFVADRFRRIWAIVEDIAATPGQSRLQMAEKYHLSERQVQEDLNIIRAEMRLPLRRDGGYRFSLPGERPAATNIALTDALVLLSLVARARREHSKLTVHLDGLASRLPSMFPAHLQPLVRYALRSEIGAALVAAMLNDETIKLQYPITAPPVVACHGLTPIVKPVVMMPLMSSWYLIGYWPERSRHIMLNLDAVRTVAVVP
jgi:hypothetical protein